MTVFSTSGLMLASVLTSCSASGLMLASGVTDVCVVVYQLFFDL